MAKFKNNMLIKNIFILLLSGGVTKVIGMFGKIIYTRTAGINVVSLYTLLTPTFMLIITICQFSFPISISKISAENKYDDKKLLKSAYKLGFIIDGVLIIIILLLSNLIALSLNNKMLAPAIRSICIIIPFVTVTSIQRGFLHGKEDMFLPSVTNIIEEIIKMILIIFFLPFAISISNITGIIFIILSNVVMETSTMLVLSKRIKIYTLNSMNKINNHIMKEIIDISFPTTLIRLISCVGFFLEPIILTNDLLGMGYLKDFITIEYGIINSYVIPLLSFPTFFSVAIASALLPNVTKDYSNNKYDLFTSKISKLLFISLIIGIIYLSFVLIFPRKILEFVYGISKGINYIYLMGPFFIFLYIQPTLSVCMQASGNTNKLFITSTISVIIKYVLLHILCKLDLGMNSLAFSIIAGIILTTILNVIMVLKIMKRRT